MKRHHKNLLQGAAAGAIFGIIAGLVLTFMRPWFVFGLRGFLVVFGGFALAGAAAGVYLAYRWRDRPY